MTTCLFIHYLLLGYTVEVFIDKSNNFISLLFQDGLMKTTYAAYPEFFLVDATYMLNELRMPVYFMLVMMSILALHWCMTCA